MKARVRAEFSLRSVSRIAACLLALCCVLASESGAALVIDEVLISGSSTGRSSEPPSVKLYNSGPASADLTGWRVTDHRASGGEIYTLPAVILAAGQYAVVHMGTGSDELDASDGVIHLYTGLETSFEGDDAAALYQGPVTAANLRDFVAWSSANTPVTGDAMDDAVASSQWLASDWVDITAMGGGGSLARLPSGYDTDSPNDWGLLELAARMAQSDSSTQNPVQIAPQHGQVFLNNLVPFSFVGPAWAEKYNLQVDNNSDFSSPEINQEFSPPSLAAKLASTPAAALGAGIYYYRVRVKPPGQPYLGEAAVWVFAIDDAGAPAASGGVQIAATQQTLHGVGRRLQHKDSTLVCIWDQNAFGGGAPSTQNGRGRPGCDPFRFPGQAWDAAHAETAAHVAGCGHCAFYCARACTQMLDHFYGGNLLQDRISYHIRNGDLAGPEGDLGHDRGFADGEVTTALNWALQVAGVTYTPYFGATPKATFAQYKGYLANGPVVAGVPNHVVVADGWRETTFGILTIRSIHIQDPWPGNASGWFLFDTWIRTNDAVWSLPAGDKVGRNNEAAVTTDGDGDGLMDFDEQNPRPFCSLSNDPDTEDDEVNDKREVEAYTFHEERDHAGHDNDAAPVGFADVDADGLRSECDCDSDNDSDFDGGEDIDGNGDGGMGGWPETDMFRDPHTLLVLTDKKLYFVGETVKLTGWDLHRTSTYPYDIIATCPDLVDGQGIGQSGTVTTNAFGRFPWTAIFVCPAPGEYLAVVDVLKDHLYSEPDNWDPWTCFTCIQPYIPNTPYYPCIPRTQSPGELVTVDGAVITGYTVTGPPGVYVQDPNSPCGLRVNVITSAPIGRVVSFQGVRSVVGCEPAVQASQFDILPHNLDIRPVYMRNRDVGGIPLPGTQPLADPYGPNNTCSLITVSGFVVEAHPFSSEFLISDGSMAGGDPVRVKVMLGPWGEVLAYHPGEFVEVTGISSGDYLGNRAVIIRTPNDIKTPFPT